MEIEENELREIMKKVFIAGKKTCRCDNDTMNLWIEDEIRSLKDGK